MRNMGEKINILFGISSSIAAYKILDLIRICKEEEGFNIYVMMTKNASLMINSEEFRKISGHKVNIDLFEETLDYKTLLQKKQIEHINMASKADIIVIAPATANIIGKIAHGIADDFITTVFLAAKCPKLICPAMNTVMWQNRIVQDNICELRRRGIIVLEPETGFLSCGSFGIGRLADIKVIKRKILEIIGREELLRGKKIIVTAGGTREQIDPVRVIANKSSGKMGVALAEKLYLMGAKVLLIRAATSVTAGFPIKEVIFDNGKQLAEIIRKYIRSYDLLFHSAAVSDFILEKKSLKKIDSSKSINLRLKPAVKILHQIKIWNPKIKLIGFKAVYKLTDKKMIEEGLKKIKQSKADYIIVNDVGRKGVGFEVDTNEVIIVSSNGLVKKIDKAPKAIIAERIIEIIFGFDNPVIKENQYWS